MFCLLLVFCNRILYANSEEGLGIFLLEVESISLTFHMKLCIFKYLLIIKCDVQTQLMLHEVNDPRSLFNPHLTFDYWDCNPLDDTIQLKLSWRQERSSSIVIFIHIVSTDYVYKKQLSRNYYWSVIIDE